MFKPFKRPPRNPDHFVYLSTMEDYVFLQKIGDRCFFKCYYGYFWYVEAGYGSKLFYETLESCIRGSK